MTDPEHILCFQIFDFYRGKFDFRHWLELIAIIFCRHPRIRILDHYMHHFDPPQTVVQTLKTIDTWSRANTAGRAIQRLVWSDKYAIEAGARQSDQPLDPPVGRLFIYRGKLKPVLVPYIYYSHTDLLQAPGAIVICCPADLVTNSATTRYILREYGTDEIFAKRPSMGSVLHLDRTLTKQEDHHIF